MKNTTHYISHHAVTRLRERLNGSKLAKKTDEELKQLIDEAICEKGREPAYDTREKDSFSICRMESFTDLLGGAPVAVLRKNDKKASQDWAVATVFAESYVSKKFALGEWTQDKPGKPFNGIKGVPPVADPVPDVATVKAPITMLITWWNQDAGARQDEYAYDAVAGRVRELLEDPRVIVGSIRVWKQVPMTVRREVRVEIGA